MRTALNYLLPILFLLGGLLFLALAELLKSFSPQWATLLLMFLIGNIALAKTLNLSDHIRSAWSCRKITHFPLGCLIGVTPAAAVLILTEGGLDLNWIGIKFSMTGVATTLAIVSWEELWFRGVALEYAALRYSKVGAALIFAAIFCALHIFNPSLDFAFVAPDLLLGGYSLAMCYFVFGSIWAPLGMHFANNLLEGGLQRIGYLPLHSQPFLYLAFSSFVAAALTITYFKGCARSFRRG